MRRRRGRLRRIVTGLVALCVALLVAGYAIIASLDVQQVARVARDEVKALTGRDLVIDGPIDLKISLTPSVDLQDVRFANAGWGSRPEMATLRRVEVEVELLPLLTGNVVVRRLVVIEPDILLETDAAGRGNWEFETAGDGAAAPVDAGDSGAVQLPDIQDFRFQGGRLRFVDTASGQELTLDIVEATGRLPIGGGGREIHLMAAYNGNPFAVDGTYGGIAALLSGTPGPLDLTVTAGGATVTARGTAGTLSADLAVTAAGDDLSEFSPWVGTDLPPLGPYSLSANLKSDRQSFDFSGLVVKLGESDLTGNLALSLAGPRPALRGRLVSQLLDLDDLTGAPTTEVAASDRGDGSGGAEKVFDDTPLPLEALRAVDAQVKLSVEKFSAGNLLLDDVQTDLVLKAGDLSAAPLSAGLAGGRLDGRLAINAGEAVPDLVLRLDGRGIDFGDLLERAGISDEVGGELELALDLTGRGATPHAIAAGLGGHVQAVSLDGTVDNSLLRFLNLGVSDIIAPLYGAADSARLECLVARFDIEGGQARSRALVFDTGAFAVAGRGGIDLDAEQLNLAFDTQTSEPSLASFAVPFRVTGPLSDPDVSPDPVGAAVGAVGNVAKTGGNIVGGAVDAVGGLVGSGPIIGQVGSGETLCGEALAAIGRGPSGGGAAPAKSRSVVDDAVEGVGDAVKGAGEGIEKGLENLFGN